MGYRLFESILPGMLAEFSISFWNEEEGRQEKLLQFKMAILFDGTIVLSVLGLPKVFHPAGFQFNATSYRGEHSPAHWEPLEQAVSACVSVYTSICEISKPPLGRRCAVSRKRCRNHVPGTAPPPWSYLVLTTSRATSRR